MVSPITSSSAMEVARWIGSGTRSEMPVAHAHGRVVNQAADKVGRRREDVAPKRGAAGRINEAFFRHGLDRPLSMSNPTAKGSPCRLLWERGRRPTHGIERPI